MKLTKRKAVLSGVLKFYDKVATIGIRLTDVKEKLLSHAQTGVRVF